MSDITQAHDGSTAKERTEFAGNPAYKYFRRSGDEIEYVVESVDGDEELIHDTYVPYSQVDVRPGVFENRWSGGYETQPGEILADAIEMVSTDVMIEERFEELDEGYSAEIRFSMLGMDGEALIEAFADVLGAVEMEVESDDEATYTTLEGQVTEQSVSVDVIEYTSAGERVVAVHLMVDAGSPILY